MNIPVRYQWLNNIGTLPKVIEAGLKLLGISEIPGTRASREIMDMAKQLGISSIYSNDDIAWCGLYVCYILKLTGKPMPYKNFEIVRAASFAGGGLTKPQAYGVQVKRGDEQLGDIVVFHRPGGYHVGFAIAFTKNDDGSIKTVHVLGGNQSNKVSIAEIDYKRLIDCRRYYATAAPASAKRYYMSSSGLISKNEA